MDLRELKKEVQELSNVEENFSHFQNNWVKPIRSNTNAHLPSLNNLDVETKRELNQKLLELQDTFLNIRSGQQVTEKLASYIHYLIELKLTTLNGDKNKFKFILQKLVKEEHLNLQNTFQEIKLLENSLDVLKLNYGLINQQLEEKLPLEDKLTLLDQKSKHHLLKIEQTVQKQKELAQQMGKHLVQLAKQVPTKKKST